MNTMKAETKGPEAWFDPSRTGGRKSQKFDLWRYYAHSKRLETAVLNVALVCVLARPTPIYRSKSLQIGTKGSPLWVRIEKAKLLISG